LKHVTDEAVAENTRINHEDSTKLKRRIPEDELVASCDRKRFYFLLNDTSCNFIVHDVSNDRA
jgi:hypothetical protein